MGVQAHKQLETAPAEKIGMLAARVLIGQLAEVSALPKGAQPEQLASQLEQHPAFAAALRGGNIARRLENGELLRQQNVGSREILLGVRPEHINLAEAGEDTINGTILVNEMMGSELHLHVRVDDNSKMIVRTPTVNLTHEERTQLRKNQPVHLSFPGKVMYFFDPETEKNLLY